MKFDDEGNKLAQNSRKKRVEWTMELSDRMREWGSCEMMDVDFLMLSHDDGTPVALFEYKYKHATYPQLDSYKGMLNLANMAGIPFFIMFYTNESQDGYWSFFLHAVNDQAKKVAQCEVKICTEKEFVRFQHHLRGRSGLDIGKLDDKKFPAVI